MAERSSGRKASPTRKLKTEQSKSEPATQPAVTQEGIHANIGGPAASSRLEQAISELQGLNELLLSGDLDPHILRDFRDALNRVRTAAWAAQQYVARKETDQGSSSVLSLLVGARIRTTYQLWVAGTSHNSPDPHQPKSTAYSWRSRHSEVCLARSDTLVCPPLPLVGFCRVEVQFSSHSDI